MIEINNIYNKDCLELMQEMLECGFDGKVDFILTDPPYNIDFKPPRQNCGTAESRIKIQNDNMGDVEFYNFIKTVFSLCYKLLKNDSFLITFMGWSSIPTFEKALTECGFTIKSMPIWVKECFGIGYYTRPQYEPMYLCFKGNPKPLERPISDVIQVPRAKNIIHSCQKPRDLLQILINSFSNEGDLILDPFGGSFSTCVAAKKCGRNYISCEIDKTLYLAGKDNLDKETNQISLFDL